MMKKTFLPNIEHSTVREKQDLAQHLIISNGNLNLNTRFNGDGGNLLHNVG